MKPVVRNPQPPFALATGLGSLPLIVVGLSFSLSQHTLAQPVALPPAPSGVETFTHQGIQFSRIQAPNVEALDPVGGHWEGTIGGGSWDFGIARTELTQVQWVEFINAFKAVPVPEGQSWSGAMNNLLLGTGWIGPGMFFTEIGPQGRPIERVTALGAVLPARGMSWYGAALYCNWLQNGREVSLDALNNGVYDLRQWNDADPQTWPAPTRQAGAQYWIPSYDEWALASFYDVNRFGPGEAGWWPYQLGQDRTPIAGPPGEAETAAGWGPEPFVNDVFLYPIASYPESQSPWGLLDTSGTYAELLEDQWPFGFDRLYAGTQAGPFAFPDLDVLHEQPGWYGADTPISSFLSFRIATSVPAPSSIAIGLCAWGFTNRRRRAS